MAPVPDDPFQQLPRDATGELPRASAAFAAKRYAQAAALFADADRRKENFTEAQREEWNYCRLHAVAVQLNGAKGIFKQGRHAQGVRLMNLRDEDVVSADALVMEDEADTEADAEGGADGHTPVDELPDG